MGLFQKSNRLSIFQAFPKTFMYFGQDLIKQKIKPNRQHVEILK